MNRTGPSSAPHSTFAERLRQGDTYGLLLILLVATYFVLALAGTTEWDRFVTAVMFGGVLLLTLHTSRVRGRWMRIAVIVISVTLLLNVVQAIIGDDLVTGLGYLWIAFAVASPVVILQRILRHPAVELETILGALCAYVLIALAFAAIYAMLQEVGSENFFAQPPPYERVDFLYFSFVTMTTTGFGDLTASTPLGKVLVTLEALIGTVFLVTIVASLVASFGEARRRTPGDG